MLREVQIERVSGPAQCVTPRRAPMQSGAILRTVAAFLVVAAGAIAQTAGGDSSPYSFRDEIFVGGNYTRASTGPDLSGANFGGWNVSHAHYFTPLLGMAVDAQGMYGNAPLDEALRSLSNPLIRKHSFLAGPQLRWRRGRRVAASIRLLTGVANTSTSDLTTPTAFGLYENATKLAFKLGGALDFNLSPRMALRIANGALIERQNGGFKAQISPSVGLVFRFGSR
jgi:hypothetical protein